jgi:hypothetical protein
LFGTMEAFMVGLLRALQISALKMLCGLTARMAHVVDMSTRYTTAEQILPL